MKDLLISLDSNVLRVSYCGPEGCTGFSQKISSEIVQDSQILDTEKFTEQLIELSSSLLPIKNKPDALSFLVDPQDIILSFLTVNKGDSSIEEQLVEAAISKIDTPLEDLYFNYTKIAPFVYQFIGVRKLYLDSLLNVASLWGVPIKSVVPWVMLLPKTLESSAPAIFIGSFDGKHTVALSELNGIYFASTYEEEKTDKELTELVKQLSLYNRSKPIENVYTVNSAFSIGGQYKVHPILEEESFFGEEGFEVHDLVLKVMKHTPDLLGSKMNLLGLLPLPEVRSKSKTLVPVSVALSLALFAGGYLFFFRERPSNSATLVTVPSEVLSDVSVVPETSTEQTPENVEEMPNGGVYTKDDFIIRVENASEINGAAGRTQDLLENLGFKVESIGTAPNQLELTQVLITEKLMDLKEEIKEALGKDIPVGVVDVLDELGPDEEYSHNVLIRLGKDSSI